MSENLTVAQGSREERYLALIPQIEALLAGETDPIANMANVTAALKQTFGFFWVGFYVVKGDVLVLAPFQGTIACTRIGYGRGVCGTAWKEARVQVVPDVDKFPDHIACSSASRSEIVVPIFRNNDGNDHGDKDREVVAVLDIDSDAPDSFDDTDALYLEKICRLL